MAHYAKYRSDAVPAMMHHYMRDRAATLERDNIDPERTRDNYLLGPGKGFEDVQERMREVGESAGRAVRSDAIVMCDWVVTVPPDVRQEDWQRFFEGAYGFVSDRYGEGNMLGGWVHMDEATPHAHIAFMPVVEKADGRLAFSAKTLIDRSDLSRFHDDLSKAMERELGYRCQIRLDDDDRLGKVLSRVDGMGDFQMLKDEIREHEGRLERLRSAELEAGERNRELLETLRREEGRERQVEETYRERQEKAQELRGEVDQARGGVERLERGIEVVKEKIREAGRNLERLRDLARGSIERIRAFFGGRDSEREEPRIRELLRTASEERELFTGYAREMGFSSSRCNRIEMECAPIERRVESLQRELDRARGSVEESRARLDELSEHKLRNRARIPEARQELERGIANQSRIEGLVREQEEKLAPLREQMRGEREQYDEARELYEESYGRYSAMTREIGALYDGLAEDRRRDLEDSLGRQSEKATMRDVMSDRGLDLDERVFERRLDRMGDREKCAELYTRAEGDRGAGYLARAERIYKDLGPEDREKLATVRDEARSRIEPEREIGHVRELGWERGR